CDRQPLLPPARQGVDSRTPVREPAAAQRMREPSGPILLVDRGQHGHHDLLDASSRPEHRILWDRADTDAGAEGPGATVGPRLAGQNSQEGGFAGAIGADEPGLITFEQSQGQAVEERPGAVGLAEILTAEQERSGHPASLLLRLLLFFPHARTFRHGLTPSPRALPRSASRRL